MRARHVVAIACAGLLLLAASAGADEFGPPEPVAPDSAAGQVEAPEPSATAIPAVTPAPVPTAVSETAVAQQATPVHTPTAVAESAAAAQAPPTATVVAAAVGTTTAGEQATRARTVTVAVAAQATPTPEPAPPAASGCATPVEDAATGECRVSSAVCTILGTADDDVLPGSPFDDILCGLGGDDRLDGGDGDDVLLGGDGDDVLVGGEGDDCMVGGPGSDRAENTDEEFPEVEESANVDPYGGLIEQYARGITFDVAGKCTGAEGYDFVGGAQVAVPRAGFIPAPPAGAPVAAASSPASGGLRLGLPDTRLAVRDDVVRVPVSCSAEVPAELVLLAGSQRIAHKRFTCTPPDEKVRVRLNAAGRELVAGDDRVQARLSVLAGGRTVSRQVQLVSPGG